jgi:cellulose synthase/poly-beta-1,6-N-acetylglucosamine synthase-like glycosyltransferase
MTGVFFICLALLVYTLAGYPLLIWAISRLRPTPPRRDGQLRPATIIICARNEQATIEARLDNLRALDYPQRLLEIIVVSDGSTDGTEEIVGRRSDGAVKLMRNEIALGKAAALNAGVAEASHEIVIFGDARQRFDSGVVRRLVSHFADSSVGAVSGRLSIKPFAESAAAAGIGTYWNYEVWLRTNEAISDSAIGATGAIYAMRKSLYKPLPEGLILDDVLIPMRVVLQGKRVLYDSHAVAIDEKPVHDKSEMTRKVRTLYGNLQLCSLAPELFSLRANRLWLRFISHKMLRLGLPFLFVGCFMSSLLAGGWLTWLGIGQCIFWAVAAVSWLAGVKSFPWKAFSGLLLLNVAVFMGWYKFLTGREDVWTAASSNIPESRAIGGRG